MLVGVVANTAAAATPPDVMAVANQMKTVMEGDGQGLAWLVFALWFVLPLLLFFLVLTFTG